METESAPPVRESSDNSVADSTYLEALLRRPVTDTPVDPLAATRQAGGVRLGTLKRFDGQGRAYVQIDGQPQPQICAGALVALQAQDIGRRVALGFAGGETQNPIILGLLHEAPGAVQISSPQPVSIEQKGKRTIIQASGEMELRCGEAVILMQADGRIQLRGTYITSHASAGQRIRGGSVQIN